MADRLNKSLDDIITDSEAQQRRGRGRGGGSSMAARGRQGQRRERKPEPYDTRRQPRGDRNERSADEAHTYECAIKYLLDNNKSGSFIGNGGASIKDMIEITGASIHISNPTRCHPLTGDRVVFITGSEESVGLAQALVWEMIGQQTDAENEGLKDLIWNPAAAKASPGQYDTVEVSCQVVIPAAAGGRVMGRNGSVFRSMASDCGVTAHISAVEDSELLQERIVTIEGTVGECMNFSAMLLAKLMEVADGCQYVYSGSAYPRQLTAGAGGDAGSVTGGRGRASNSSSSNRRAPREDSVGRPAGRNSVRGKLIVCGDPPLPCFYVPSCSLFFAVRSLRRDEACAGAGDRGRPRRAGDHLRHHHHRAGRAQRLRWRYPGRAGRVR
jgi:hypothetical protein